MSVLIISWLLMPIIYELVNNWTAPILVTLQNEGILTFELPEPIFK